MLAVFVRFDSDDQFDRAALTEIAENVRGMFEGMAGLRSKVFTLSEDHTHATNVYLWDSEDAARAFFTPELTERVTGLYGVKPRIEFAEVLAVIDNS
jgi:heme-degrading monooxygenase HmoA